MSISETTYNQCEYILGTKENPILVKNIDEFNNVKKYRYIKYICRNCGKENVVYTDPRHHEKQKRLLCTQCAIKDSIFQKYGVEHALQSEQIKSKMKENLEKKYGIDNVSKLEEIKLKKEKTCLSHFGETNNLKLDSLKDYRKKVLVEKYSVENAFQSDEIKEKIKETNLEKYGTEFPMKNKAIQQKAVETNNLKYGVDYPLMNNEIKEKCEQTNIKKYGVVRAIMRNDIIEKRKESNIKKYGVDSPSKLESVKEKYRNTCLKKYGTSNFSQSEFFKNIPNKYEYDNNYFDSSWELAFYVYHKSLGNNIIREPISIKYIHNDEIHYYHPDFEVNGQLYEIKGSQFFKEDGTMQNPYNHKLDKLYEAKHQCALKNNVIFIQDKQIKMYLNYVNEKYGKHFLKSCINIKNDKLEE